MFGDHSLPTLSVFAIMVPFLTLHSSLQHEVLHGHPFKNQMLNDLLVIIPFGLLVPYYRFKDTHLTHHNDTNLCDPYDDPESWYQAPDDWFARSKFSQTVFEINNTLVGRMLLGPLIGMTGFVKNDVLQIVGGDWLTGAKWALHIVLAGLLLALVSRFGNLSIGSYFLAAYGGMSLLMIRTFLEHQAEEKVEGRTVIIEKGGIFGFLFLYNSYHAVHHAHPGYPWYRLPKLFRENRERFLKMNDGYSYPGYWEVFRQFGFKRKEKVPYPLKLNKENQG